MSGSRTQLPPNPMKVCASCLCPRGTKTKGWTGITRSGQVVGYTCPSCPTASEPIRLKGGRFYAVVGVLAEDGARKQLTRRFDDLADAREWVQETREDAAKAKAYEDPRKVTLRTLTTRWLAKREKEIGAPGGIRPGTLNGYRSALSSLLDLLGDSIARDITADDIEAALLTLATTGGKWKRPLSHRSLVYALGGLRQVYAYALRSNWVKSNPATLVKAPRPHGAVEDDTPHQPKRWSTNQVRQFRDYVDGLPLDAEPWLMVGMRLTLCGLRRSEVLGLDWSNVNRKTGDVRVAASRTKDGRGSSCSLAGTKTDNGRRTVQADVIHPGTAAAIRKLWLQQGRPDSGLVIVDTNGRPVQPDAYSRRFKSLCDAAVVPYLGSIHNTRHTLATALKEAGVPDHHAAALLGHDVATYRRFYLVTDDDGAASAAAVAGQLYAV